MYAGYENALLRSLADCEPALGHAKCSLAPETLSSAGSVYGRSWVKQKVEHDEYNAAAS